MKSLTLVVLALCACATAPEPRPSFDGGPNRTVARLYELVTFEAGRTPDWDAVRALFVDEAVVVLRTGPEELTTFTLDGFVQDFITFIEQSKVEETGFTERALVMKETSYRDFATVLVHFETWIPGSDRPPSEGLDSFELIRRPDGWKIVSIVNERPPRGEAIPAELFERTP